MLVFYVDFQKQSCTSLDFEGLAAHFSKGGRVRVPSPPPSIALEKCGTGTRETGVFSGLLLQPFSPQHIPPQSQGCADCDDPPEACVSLLYAELAKGGALDTGA